jgi:hypothetical protein
MDLEDPTNIIGIALEILGFILILKAAIHPERMKGGRLDDGFPKEAINVMTIISFRRYNWGIALVIAGLAIQIVPSLVSLT